MRAVNRHRAVNRYPSNGVYRGKKLSQREIQRRIAQSYGYSIRKQFAETAEKPVVDHSVSSGETVIIA